MNFKSHKFDKCNCTNHNCDDCMFIHRKYTEEPCNDCYKAINSDKCYFELRTEINNIVELLCKLTAEERLEVFYHFCIHCGDIQENEDRRCQCWNDD